MLRKTILEKFSAVRDAINGPGNAYFSGRPKRLKHVEGKKYKRTACVPSLAIPSMLRPAELLDLTSGWITASQRLSRFCEKPL
jgi:hypothetical protein